MVEHDRHTVFDDVLFVGPMISSLGGIQAVMQSYRDTLPSFTYLPTNSKHGTLPGLFIAFWSLLKMPWMRWVGHKKILHVHSASGKSFRRKAVFLRCGKLLGFRTVFHSHGGNMRKFVEQCGKEKVGRFLSRQDQVVALTEQWRQYFADDLGLKDAIVINNIVSRPKLPPKVSTSDQTLTLLFLGRLEKAKGIFDLLEAIADHRDELRGHLQLRIGGNDVDGQLHNMLTTLGIADMVAPLGWIGGDTKAREIAAADVIILPSYIEGLPISLLEAMASGRGIITTPVGGIPSIVSDRVNGFLITPGDKEAMVAAIKEYITQRDLIKKHGRESQLRVERFYPEAVVAELEKMYKNILAK